MLLPPVRINSYREKPVHHLVHKRYLSLQLLTNVRRSNIINILLSSKLTSFPNSASIYTCYHIRLQNLSTTLFPIMCYLTERAINWLGNQKDSMNRYIS